MLSIKRIWNFNFYGYWFVTQYEAIQEIEFPSGNNENRIRFNLLLHRVKLNIETNR